jgi:hypothetical protein
MVRFMGEHTVDVPLWDERGLMFNTREELVQAWDLSDDLVSDIVKWAREWQSRAGQPDHDAQAARLVRRINHERKNEVQVVYKP